MSVLARKQTTLEFPTREIAEDAIRLLEARLINFHWSGDGLSIVITRGDKVPALLEPYLVKEEFFPPTRPDPYLERGTDEYFKVWDEFIQPLIDFLGIEPYGFDPTVSYIHEGKMVQLPTWFVQLFNEKLGEQS